ncbi:tail fiber assembly protein [Lelliottia amnigena]|uniref:tail fiber assembly protein n=1 Tax=Lelliottia amnigena TaxID=61646 RepID=UPI0040576278
MTEYYYSASENGFMPAGQKEIYVAAGTWPDDAVEVDEEVFIEFTQTPPAGKIRGGNKDGLPVWLDVPAPTHEESVAAADAEKHRLESPRII